MKKRNGLALCLKVCAVAIWVYGIILMLFSILLAAGRGGFFLLLTYGSPFFIAGIAVFALGVMLQKLDDAKADADEMKADLKSLLQYSRSIYGVKPAAQDADDTPAPRDADE